MMFDSFHLQLHVAMTPTPAATVMVLQACQALGNQALALRLMRALDLTPDQKVVILLSGGLREEVKVLDLEPALYYLQGLLDGARLTLRQVQYGLYDP
jgi:hypothetical protein